MRVSLAEQLAQLETPAPADLDPEDGYRSPVGSNGEKDEEPNELATSHYVDVGSSILRRGLDSISDPKYDGAPTSRRDIEEDPASGEEESDSVAQDDTDSNSEILGNIPEHVPLSPPNQEMPPSTGFEPVFASSASEMQSSLRMARAADRMKGAAVIRQLTIWDSLLDARIKLQKAVAACNRLPAPPTLSQLSESENCRNSLKRAYEEALLLSSNLFDIREYLCAVNEKILPPPRKKQKASHGSSESATCAYAALVRDSCEATSSLENSFHPHLLQTLSKWSTKVQAVAPSVLLPSNRGSFVMGKNRHVKSAAELIDEAILDHPKLLSRTQAYRGDNKRLFRQDCDPTEEISTLNTSVFDDTDYYQQLLKEVIDGRRNAALGMDDWRTLQKERKARKKVDTKASKGRKLRYEIHDKLQNFMFPTPSNIGWHDEQIDELFSSLLGRGFESSSEMHGPALPALASDFRVF